MTGRAWTGVAKSRSGHSRTVRFYFRKDGTSSYVYKGSTTASAAGYFKRSFTAVTTGTWSARVDRTPTKTPATVYDHVRVVVTTTLYKSWSGSGDWQSPRIYMPTA